MKVKFYTLGCKVNQYESQAMGEALRKKGFEITEKIKTAKSAEQAGLSGFEKEVFDRYYFNNQA